MSPLLKVILVDLDNFSQVAFDGQQLLVTSIYRTPEEDKALKGSGIHATIPFRAADVRANSWTDPEITTLADRTNFLFQYDQARPHLLVALFKPHGVGAHCHFQICEHTVAK